MVPRLEVYVHLIISKCCAWKCFQSTVYICYSSFSQIDNFIDTHFYDKGPRNGHYATVRNAKAIVHAWKTKLSLDKIMNVQKSCQNYMSNLGYNLIKDWEQKHNLNFTILGKTKEEVWPSLAEV